MTAVDSIPGVHIGPPHWSKVVGSVLCRAVVPAWVFAGAVFKLMERDPQLLPPPVLDAIKEIGSSLGADLPFFLMFSMRAIIAVELMAVAVMVLFPRLSRLVAAAMLSLFLLILAVVLWRGFEKGGFSGMMSDCGCFGSKGPPAPVMFLVDAALLVGVLRFRVPLSAHWPKVEKRMAAIAAAVAIAGAVVAFAVPAKSFDFVAADDPATADGDDSAAPTASSTSGFGPRPPTPEPYYFDKFEDWVGKPIAAQPLAQQISRPLPEGFPQGRWFIVLYRADCEHCHVLLEEHFSGPLETPTLAVAIPDTDPAADLGMPCGACSLHAFTKGPQYVLTTPVLLTVVDGMVLCACEDADDAAKLAECLDAR